LNSASAGAGIAVSSVLVFPSGFYTGGQSGGLSKRCH